MIKLNISNEHTGISVNLKSMAALSAEEIMSVVHLVNKTQASQIIQIERKVQIEPKSVLSDPVVVTPKEEPKPRPRAVELLNNEHRLSNPIGDILQHRSVFNRVKVYINCPNCGNEQDGSTYEHNSYTKCPQCETKLFNTYATDASLAPDEDGYTYMATSILKPKLRFEDEDAANE